MQHQFLQTFIDDSSQCVVRIAIPLLVCAVVALPANAIFWNNDPARGVTSQNGLTDRIDWFQNTHVIRNLSNNTQGTATLLNSEWAITVRHVVQNGGNYGQIAAPENIFLDLSGRRFFADQIFTPDGGSEMALVHLRGGDPAALDATGTVNGSFNEAGRIMHTGGYGYRGHFDAGGTMGLGSFRRAYNIGFIAGNGQIRIIADGEATLANNGLLEGTVGSGDSGGPTLDYYGRGDYSAEADMDSWRLVGLTATGSGGAGGENWGGSSNLTRVANYANWINSTLVSLPDVGPPTTGAWELDSGNQLYDTAGDRFSVTGPNTTPAVSANFGPDGAGFTLDSVGDTLSLTALVDTTLEMDASALRFGMFDDAAGTIAGDINGGTPWNGYFISNSTEAATIGPLEKGPGAGVGQWWSTSGANTATGIGRAPRPSGTFDDPAGSQNTPAGLYELALSYTREADGLRIDYSTMQVNSAGNPTGVYELAGSILDSTPASWTFNQLGFQLFGGSYTGTVIVDDILVDFSDVLLLPGDFDGNGVVGSGDYILWRNSQGQMGPGLPADGNGDMLVNAADYVLWRNHYGESIETAGGSIADTGAAVPEPTAATQLLVAAAMLVIWRPRQRGRHTGRLVDARISDSMNGSAQQKGLYVSPSRPTR
jgi:hypothetical protein